MRQRHRAAGAITAVALCFLAGVAPQPAAQAVSLDKSGALQLGVRAYTAARVGSEHTDIAIHTDASGRQISRNLTFPVSAAGHLRQHRTFIEVTLRHDLDRLIKEGVGPLALLSALPFRINRFGYFLSYRGEAEGIYDYGPREYSTSEQFRNQYLVPPGPSGESIDVGALRRRLRRVASYRNRLFQAYVEGEVGDLFIRFGRQILAWGETDVFRLLDNINPLDASFGGFLLPLDERRVPLDMLRLNYYIGQVPGTPLYEAYVEAFGVIDDAVGFVPGTPKGSPWALPNDGVPSTLTATVASPPARNFADMRGGVQLRFNAPVPGIEEATFSLAHYYTYFDTQAVQVFTAGDPSTGRFFPVPMASGPGAGYPSLAVQTAPRVRVTGAATTFVLPMGWTRPLGLSGEAIIRSELAYFDGEPRFRQSELDPYVFALLTCPGGTLTPDGLCASKRRTGDSWNFVVGFDTNQWIRLLNRGATFFVTTQFFYRHLRDTPERRDITTPRPALPGQPTLVESEVLPVAESTQSPDRWRLPSAASEPFFVHSHADQFLQTLQITTSYRSGTIVPTMAMIYDWAGAFVAQPQVVFVRDPFRFTVSYSFLTSSRLRGGSGISLLRDRDNVYFQLEYSL